MNLNLKIKKKYLFQLFALIIIFFYCISTINLESDPKNDTTEILEEGDNESTKLKNSNVYYRDTVGSAFSVYVDGDYAYMADGLFSGLAIINISNPKNPGSPVYRNTTGNAFDVCISGDYAFIANGGFGLVVINISDPTNPGMPKYTPTSGAACDIFIDGDFAFIADEASGLAIINISDPNNPGTPKYMATSGNAYGVYVSGDYAYIADEYSGLAVIDISDPNNPGTPYYEDTDGIAYDVYVDGDYAYIADGSSGLAIFNISDPTNPEPPVYMATSGTANSVCVSGDYAYVADGSSGLAVIDISDPTNPGTPGYEDTIGNSVRLFISGDYAYVADGSSGLAVIQISKPSFQVEPIYEDTTGNSQGIDVSGNYVYLADGSSGLAIIDISDPTNPGTPVYKDTDGNANSVYVSGDYAYVADGSSGLAIIDISNPKNPGMLYYEDTNGDATGVYISGNYAYVADGSTGLAIINISDPTDPGTPVYKDTDYSAKNVFISGDFAYVADGDWLAIINISNPSKPGNLINVNTTGFAQDVYVSGNYAYVANSGWGLAVINISDPSNPGEPICEDLINAVRILIDGDYAYITDGNIGPQIINISNPTNPGTPFLPYIVNGQSYDLDIGGDYAYIAVGTEGLAVLKIRERIDMHPPIIIYETNNFSVEAGYIGQSVSWTATDPNNATYIIKLEGVGIVAGPYNWNNNTPVIYNIPNGLGVGDYFYTINFTDIRGYYSVDTINFSVIPDITKPVFMLETTNHSIELGYTGKNLSWMVNDPLNDTYTIFLEGSGIIVGPINWNSGVPVVYNIPNGLIVGEYHYIVNFTDTFDNFIIDYVNLTVEDTKVPSSTQPDNIETHTEENKRICWTIYDASGGGQYRVLIFDKEKRNNYTWVDWTNWTSGEEFCVKINRLEKGLFIYSLEFRDNYDNYGIPNDVSITIKEAPSDGAEPVEDNLMTIIIIASVVGIASMIMGMSVKLSSSRKKRARMREIKDYGDAEGKNLVFVSYATVDSTLYRIPKMAEVLSSYPEIDDVLYWETDMHDDIYAYMDENLKRCKVILLFCSKNSMASEAVNMEWRSALKKQRKVIPIFIDQDDIPPLLTTKLGIQFNEGDLFGTFEQIYQLILKKLEVQSEREFCQYIHPKQISEHKFEPATSLMAKDELIFDSSKPIEGLNIELENILKQNNFHIVEKTPEPLDSEFRKILGFAEQNYDKSKIGAIIFIQKSEEVNYKILLKVMSEKKWIAEEIMKNLKNNLDYLKSNDSD